LERIPVNVAAERMQISKDAVRKRIQRGTLASGKWPDGRRYVWWDDEWAASTINKGVDDPKNQDQGQSHSWVEYLAAGSGILALLGFLTYGLGLLAIWIPIRTAYTNDLATAWYAASLVPRTVVAGLGFAKLIGMPTLVTVGAFSIVLISNWFWDYVARWSYWFVLLLVEGFMLLSIGLYIRDAAAQYDWSLRTQATFLVGIAVALNAAFILFVRFSNRFRLRAARRRQEERAQDSRDEDGEDGVGRGPESDGTTSTEGSSPESSRAWIWLLVLIIFQYGIAAVNVSINKPTLPTVDINGDKGPKGALLTHTDGFWYVFDRKGDNRDKLVAISDDEVKKAQIFHKGAWQQRSIISISVWYSWISRIWQSLFQNGQGPH
jgi:hypothetical protein